jgi:hypothetical protein
MTPTRTAPQIIRDVVDLALRIEADPVERPDLEAEALVMISELAAGDRDDNQPNERRHTPMIFTRNDRPAAPSWDDTVPPGTDVTHWPIGWADSGSTGYVPPVLREHYRRGEPGSKFEQDLFDEMDPKCIQAVSPAGVIFDPRERSNREVVRHTVACRRAGTEFARAQAQAEADRAQAQADAFNTCRVCWSRIDTAQRGIDVIVVPGWQTEGFKICSACRAVALVQLAADYGDELVAGEQTRSAAVAKLLADAGQVVAS